MNKLEFSTPFGILATCGFIATAISIDGRLISFFDLGSVLIVLFGTFFTTVASSTFKDVIIACKISLQSILYKEKDLQKIVRQLLEISDFARKQGFLALQSKVGEVADNSILKNGVELLVDNVSDQELNKIVRQLILSQLEKIDKSINVVKKAANTAPSLGLIGTLIGLVQMLSHIDSPGSIGPAMAVALLTTFYGALLSFVILNPLSSKIEYFREDYTSVGKICLKGLVSVAQKENPMLLELVLNSMLVPELRAK